MATTLRILALLCAAALIAACGGEAATVEPEPTPTQATPTLAPTPTDGGAVPPSTPLPTPLAPTPTSGDSGGQAPTAAPTPTRSSPGGAVDSTPTPANTPAPPPADTPTPTAALMPLAGWRTDGTIGGQVGNFAPNQALTLPGGAATSLEEIAAGRPLVLYFFERW